MKGKNLSLLLIKSYIFFRRQTFLGTKSNIHVNPSIWGSTKSRSFSCHFSLPLVPVAAWVLHKIYHRWNSFNHLQIPLWNLGKVVVLGGTSQSEKGRQPPMEDRYLSRQGSGVWRSLRDGDFEEEDVWDVIRQRKNSNIMTGRTKESPATVPRLLPTASRMIPRASSHNYGNGSSYGSSNYTHEAKIVQQSAPVHIPNWSKPYSLKSKKGSQWRNQIDDGDGDDDDEFGNRDDEDEEEEEDDYDAKVPPHEFLARRLARGQISSFSVFEGAGRTLKGRDLSKVRNAVLSKTGFLESL